MTKTEAREWLKRIRSDAQIMEAALRAGDEATVFELALDASGAAMKLAEAFDKGERF